MDSYLRPHHFNYLAATGVEITVMTLQELKVIKYIHSGPLRSRSDDVKCEGRPFRNGGHQAEQNHL